MTTTAPTISHAAAEGPFTLSDEGYLCYCGMPRVDVPWLRFADAPSVCDLLNFAYAAGRVSALGELKLLTIEGVPPTVRLKEGA